jgi:RNA polymerase sigma-70 factor (ECF subfamily)
MRAEMEVQLGRAIDSLDPIDREVLILRHFEELTNSEVAEVLGLQQKAASIRYVRAAARLKAILVKFPGFADDMT